MNLVKGALCTAIAVAGLALGAGTANAGRFDCNDFDCILPTGGSASGGESTQAFVGLRWFFGTNSPALVGGLRYLKSNGDNGVAGAQFDASLPLFNTESHLPKLRLLGLFGTQDVQVQLGGGYDFGRGTMVVSAGVQGPYIDLGVDYGIDKSLAFYAGLTSLKRPEIGGDGALSCGDEHDLVAVIGNLADYDSYVGIYIDDGMINAGYTCLQNQVD